MAKKFQLKNGLTVLLVENKKSPVVSVQMWVKTGSADEEKKIAGISHFIEHLVFKGSDHYGVGEIAQVVEASGGELNAYTSFDQTVFYVTISKDFTETALDVVSQMMGHPTFDPVEIENEKEVVIEEIKRGQDSPARASSQLLFSNLFKKHPYGRPVIGYEEVIRKVTPSQIKKYYHSRYVPKNMTLVVAGHFESGEMKKKVQNYFNDFKPYPLKRIKRPKEAVIKKTRTLLEAKAFQQNSFYLAWPAPSIKHKDVAALEVLSMILGQSETSRLIQRFRIESALVNSIGSFNYPMQDAGLFAISFSLEKQNLELLLRALNEELKSLFANGITHEELQKAKTSISASEFYNMETVDQLARKVGSYYFYMQDPDYHKKYLKMILKLKVTDIEKAARKYLLPEKVCISGIHQQDAIGVEKALKTWQKEYRSVFKTKPVTQKRSRKKANNLKVTLAVKPIQSKLHVLKMPHGLTLMMRKMNETPSLVAKTAFLGGLRAEPEGQLGLSEMLSRTWGSSTESLSEMQIYELQDQMAAGTGAFSGRNSIGTSMECLNSFERPVADLFSDILLKPVFKTEIVEREKEILKNQIRKKNDNPAQICSLNFHQLMFAGHPYSKDSLGTLETADRLNSIQLQKYYEDFAHAKNASLSVVGDIDIEYWKDFAHKLDSHLGKGKRFDQKITCSDLTKDLETHIELKKEQTHIIVGYRGLSLFDSERFALDILQSILSGQGGRLFIELRDKNSLAYSVSPVMLTGYECGYFGGYIGCSPEKREKSIKMMTEQFQKLASEVVTDEELARAKRYLIGRHDIELQRKTAINNAYLFDQIYGFDPNKALDVSAQYEAVSKQDVLRLAQRLFSGFKVISSVGP